MPKKILDSLLKPNGYSTHFSISCRQPVFLFLLFWSARVLSEYSLPVTLNFNSTTEDIYISGGSQDSEDDRSGNTLITISSGVDNDDNEMPPRPHGYYLPVDDSEMMITALDLTQAIDNLQIKDAFRHSELFKSLLLPSQSVTGHYDIISVHVLSHAAASNHSDNMIDFMVKVAERLNYDELAILHNHLLSTTLSEDDFTKTFAFRTDRSQLHILNIPLLLSSWRQIGSEERLETDIEQWAELNHLTLKDHITKLRESRIQKSLNVESISINDDKNYALRNAIEKILREVASEWEQIGIQLEIPPIELDDIKADNEKLESRMRAVIRTYVQKKGSEATVGELLSALEELELNVAAQKLKAATMSFAQNPRHNTRLQ